jgi:hypothetical protein
MNRDTYSDLQVVRSPFSKVECSEARTHYEAVGPFTKCIHHDRLLGSQNLERKTGALTLVAVTQDPPAEIFMLCCASEDCSWPMLGGRPLGWRALIGGVQAQLLLGEYIHMFERHGMELRMGSHRIRVLGAHWPRERCGAWIRLGGRRRGRINERAERRECDAVESTATRRRSVCFVCISIAEWCVCVGVVLATSTQHCKLRCCRRKRVQTPSKLKSYKRQARLVFDRDQGCRAQLGFRRSSSRNVSDPPGGMSYLAHVYASMLLSVSTSGGISLRASESLIRKTP